MLKYKSMTTITYRLLHIHTKLTEHSGHTFVNLGIIYFAQGVNNLETESETNKLTTDIASFFPLRH